MNQSHQKILLDTINDILKNIPHRPFMCLPLSATLYAILKDNHQINTRLVTGDLFFKDYCIFKQDFSIAETTDSVYREWCGYAWVEMDEWICDLSFFRTLYSDMFNRPYKEELVSMFGVGRGALIASQVQLQALHLTYSPIDTLPDEMATGIINGIETLLKGQVG